MYSTALHGFLKISEKVNWAAELSVRIRPCYLPSNWFKLIPRITPCLYMLLLLEKVTLLFSFWESVHFLYWERKLIQKVPHVSNFFKCTTVKSLVVDVLTIKTCSRLASVNNQEWNTYISDTVNRVSCCYRSSSRRLWSVFSVFSFDDSSAKCFSLLCSSVC